MKSELKKFSIFNSQFSISKGFTLIELLIVIAILGILAAGILVAINPVEQLARGRDAGRKNTVSQLGKAVEAYFISKNAYPVAITWMQNIVDTGDIKNTPPAIAYSSAIAVCATNAANNYCYKTDTTDTIVYTKLEAAQNTTKCDSGYFTFFLYSVKYGTGILCVGNPPTDPNPATSYTFE